jgi:hypothetical protein
MLEPGVMNEADEWIPGLAPRPSRLSRESRQYTNSNFILTVDGDQDFGACALTMRVRSVLVLDTLRLVGG